MSQQNDQQDLFETFLEEKGYVETIMCPYCEKTHASTSADSGIRCCGEPHVEKFWTNDRESLDIGDVRRAFLSWLEDRSDIQADEPKVNRWDNLTKRERGDV